MKNGLMSMKKYFFEYNSKYKFVRYKNIKLEVKMKKIKSLSPATVIGFGLLAPATTVSCVKEQMAENKEVEEKTRAVKKEDVENLQGKEIKVTSQNKITESNYELVSMEINQTGYKKTRESKIFLKLKVKDASKNNLNSENVIVSFEVLGKYSQGEFKKEDSKKIEEFKVDSVKVDESDSNIVIISLIHNLELNTEYRLKSIDIKENVMSFDTNLIAGNIASSVVEVTKNPYFNLLSFTTKINNGDGQKSELDIVLKDKDNSKIILDQENTIVNFRFVGELINNELKPAENKNKIDSFSLKSVSHTEGLTKIVLQAEIKPTWLYKLENIQAKRNVFKLEHSVQDKLTIANKINLNKIELLSNNTLKINLQASDKTLIEGQILRLMIIPKSDLSTEFYPQYVQIPSKLENGEYSLELKISDNLDTTKGIDIKSMSIARYYGEDAKDELEKANLIKPLSLFPKLQ